MQRALAANRSVTRSAAVRGCRVGDPPGRSPARARVEGLVGRRQSGGVQQRHRVGLDVQTAAAAATTGSVTWRDGGVTDLEGIPRRCPGATGRRSPAHHPRRPARSSRRAVCVAPRPAPCRDSASAARLASLPTWIGTPVDPAPSNRPASSRPAGTACGQARGCAAASAVPSALTADGRASPMPSGGRFHAPQPRRQDIGDQSQHGGRGGRGWQRELVDRTELAAQSCLRHQHRLGLDLHRDGPRAQRGWISTVCDGRPVDAGAPGDDPAAAWRCGSGTALRVP